MEVTKRLAEFAAELHYEDIPSDVREQAKHAIIDAIGTVPAGIHEVSVGLLREYAVRVHRDGMATAIGYGTSLAAPAAALLNAAAAHALDYDNISLTVSGFIASPTLFAMLAVAEEEEGRSGRDIIEAFVAGWEVEAAIARGLGVHHYACGWHSTATLGHFGATVGVSKLLGFDAVKIRHAIGVAASEASGIRKMVGNMLNPFHAGKAARNGVTAARLVESGFIAHDHVIEADWGFCEAFNGKGNYDLEAMVHGVGAPFDLVDPGPVIKMYPCCALVHSAIDAVLDLKSEHQFTTDEIRRVRVLVHELVPPTMNFDNPRDGYQGKFSIPFCVATALSEGSVRLSHFTDARVRDLRMRNLMARISYEVHPDMRGYETFLTKEFSEVHIELPNGRRIEKRVMRMDNRGSRGRPATLDDLERKFKDCAEHGKTSSAVDAFAMLAKLEDVRDIREILTLLR